MNTWRPIETAPKDGTQVLLLVEFEEHATEDIPGPARTIGANNDGNVPPGEGEGWQFAGWCWCHDHYVQGTGTPVGWQPMPDLPKEDDPMSADASDRRWEDFER
jgi:hypothetical protein